MIAAVRVVPLTVHGDERGSLVALENGKNIPFDIRRVYYIFDTKQGVVRGKHAHKSLRQLLVATSGSADILCEWNGKKQTFHLDRPTEGLLIEGPVWREMLNFSPDAVLMVLADEYYDEADYIRNYEDFLHHVCKVR